MDADTILASHTRLSPNHGERKDGKRARFIVLHYTGMKSAEAAIDWLCNPESQVSCHYMVDERGAITQLVPEALRAWHAGKGAWRGETDMNSASIGIEIQNRGHDLKQPKKRPPPFPKRQIDAVLALVTDIATRNAIHPQDVIAHSDMAPRRKIDPGERFPWARLAKAGYGLWVRPSPIKGDTGFGLGHSGPDVTALRRDLALLGFGIVQSDLFDDELRFALIAFQRHFRPKAVNGLADVSTLSTLRRLLRADQSTASQGPSTK
jgi:N-acetylmuramoyl-L-alanine amidase